MRQYKVSSPSERYTGEVAGVAFAHGVATVTDADHRALSYFRRKNYKVEEITDEDSKTTKAAGVISARAIAAAEKKAAAEQKVADEAAAKLAADEATAKLTGVNQ